MSALAGLAPVFATANIDYAVFFAAAAMILAGAFGVVLSRHPVYAALSLVLTLFGVAVLFVEQDAQFLAAVQVIVYAGAIVVLFLFVIMLLGVDRREDIGYEPLRAQRPLAAVLGLVALGEVFFLAHAHWATGQHQAVGANAGGGSNTAQLARSVFTTYLLAFELTSLLLIIAVIGAVHLARRETRQASPPPMPEGASAPDDADDTPGVLNVDTDRDEVGAP